jgi:heterodisulfide reductase subunit A-like polyferredoxin
MKRSNLQFEIVGISCDWCWLPPGAIAMHHFTDEQILAQVEALFGAMNSDGAY